MKKLFRSRENRMICGVCGGVAEYFNIDPTLVRLGWVLVAACSFGTGIIAYFVAAIIMPMHEISYNSRNSVDKLFCPIS